MATIQNYETEKQALIADDAGAADNQKLRAPATAQDIVKYYAAIDVRAVEMQSNGKIDIGVSWVIYGPSGKPEMPPFPVVLYKRTSAVSDTTLTTPQGSKMWGAVDDRRIDFQIVAHARTGYQSWHIGLSEGVNIDRYAVMKAYPKREGTNYRISMAGTPFCAPYGKYRHNDAITGPALLTKGLTVAPTPALAPEPAPAVPTIQSTETLQQEMIAAPTPAPAPTGEDLIAQFQAMKEANPDIISVSASYDVQTGENTILSIVEKPAEEAPAGYVVEKPDENTVIYRPTESVAPAPAPAVPAGPVASGYTPDGSPLLDLPQGAHHVDGPDASGWMLLPVALGVAVIVGLIVWASLFRKKKGEAKSV